jgi:hypothetical protein
MTSVSVAQSTGSLKIYSKKYQGGVNSGGGNILVADFYRRSLRVLDQMGKLDRSVLQRYGIDPKKIESVSQKLVVEAILQPIVWNDTSVEAVNFPDQNGILFNSPAWEVKSNLEKDQLVVHEILGLFEVPDIKFRVSLALTEMLQKSESLFRAIINANEDLLDNCTAHTCHFTVHCEYDQNAKEKFVCTPVQ